eukprot:11068134-Karenia_brevis.AAC.1
MTPVVHVSDSSNTGFALLYKQGPISLIREAMRHHERWRFLEVEQYNAVPLVTGEWMEDANLLSPLGGPGSDRSADVFVDTAVSGSTPGKHGCDTQFRRWAEKASNVGKSI